MAQASANSSQPRRRTTRMARTPRPTGITTAAGWCPVRMPSSASAPITTVRPYRSSTAIRWLKPALSRR